MLFTIGQTTISNSNIICKINFVKPWIKEYPKLFKCKTPQGLPHIFKDSVEQMSIFLITTAGTISLTLTGGWREHFFVTVVINYVVFQSNNTALSISIKTNKKQSIHVTSKEKIKKEFPRKHNSFCLAIPSLDCF